jgi:hypothetical protein
MIDQDKAWRQISLLAFHEIDAEQDDCDREDGDPDECKLRPAEMA